MTPSKRTPTDKERTMARKITDKERLDWLMARLGNYQPWKTRWQIDAAIRASRKRAS